MSISYTPNSTDYTTALIRMFAEIEDEHEQVETLIQWLEWSRQRTEELLVGEIHYDIIKHGVTPRGETTDRKYRKILELIARGIADDNTMELYYKRDGIINDLKRSIGIEIIEEAEDE